MTQAPFRPGDFVWCAFPESEHPIRSSRRLHVGYTLAIAAVKAPTGVADGAPTGQASYRALVAYTTSRPWPHAAERPGVVTVPAEQAAEFGQKWAFWIHLWRVAHLPVTAVWFPALSDPGRCVVGRAPQAMRRELEAKTAEVFRRHAQTTEHLGPLRS